MRQYKVRAQRCGEWWALRVDGLPGAHSQARSLYQADALAKEAISLATDEDPADIALVTNAVGLGSGGLA